MKLTYKNDYKVECVLNQYLWSKANDFTLSDVDKIYAIILDSLKNNRIPIYTFEKYYKHSLVCNFLKDLSFDEIIKGFDNELIPQIKKQFIYETALFRLITEQYLIPTNSGNAHLIGEGIHMCYSNNASIQVELTGKFGNAFCYVYLGFPYYCFRISPFILNKNSTF